MNKLAADGFMRAAFHKCNVSSGQM